LVLLSRALPFSVRDEHRTSGKPKPKATKNLRRQFQYGQGRFQNRRRRSQGSRDVQEKIADLLATYTTKSVSDHVAPAQRAADTRGLPRVGWLITGEFVRVNTGSRFLRAGSAWGRRVQDGNARLV